MVRWKIEDFKAKNIHISPDGKAKKLESGPAKAKPVRLKNDLGTSKTLIESVLQASGVAFEREYRFHPTRRWRFDWYVPALRLAVEYEGIFSAKSRHTTVTGYVKDAEKYNASALMGIKVLRYTAMNVNCFAADLDKALQQ